MLGDTAYHEWTYAEQGATGMMMRKVVGHSSEQNLDSHCMPVTRQGSRGRI